MHNVPKKFQTGTVDIYEICILFYVGYQFVFKAFDWNLMQVDIITDWYGPKSKPPLNF
jgi:hypothetical protein